VTRNCRGCRAVADDIVSRLPPCCCYCRLSVAGASFDEQRLAGWSIDRSWWY
jgi:hypothetical protein